MNQKTSFTAFAPATVANVAVGFDILGFAVECVGDEVTVSVSKTPGVSIESVDGISDASGISIDPLKNTAGKPLLLMVEKFKPAFGISVRIKKGIPLGSGLGGSAASAVGAVVAANALFVEQGTLTQSLSLSELLLFALEGEFVASGSKHADNIAPCLYGGLTLSYPGAQPDVERIPFPVNLYCVLVHPEYRVDTQMARGVLSSTVSLKTYIEQSARLASFILACTTGNLALLKRGFEDLLIEPQRAKLIPGFAEVKQAALEAGVLGCSISGAGPAVFALTDSLHIAEIAKENMVRAFSGAGLSAEGWVSPIRAHGSLIV
jgi:homoserine kinase